MWATLQPKGNGDIYTPPAGSVGRLSSYTLNNERKIFLRRELGLVLSHTLVAEGISLELYSAHARKAGAHGSGSCQV